VFVCFCVLVCVCCMCVVRVVWTCFLWNSLCVCVYVWRVCEGVGVRVSEGVCVCL